MFSDLDEDGLRRHLWQSEKALRLAQLQRERDEVVPREDAAKVALRLTQALSSHKWWSVLTLFWSAWEILEPARNAYGFPGSWMYKIAHKEGIREYIVYWFGGSAALIVPSIIMLIVAQHSMYSRRAQDLAIIGLIAGSLGFGYMAAAGVLVDIPFVILSWCGDSAFLLCVAMLIANWHNARQIRKLIWRQKEEAA